MLINERLTYGIVGSVLSASGTAQTVTSTTEIQAWIGLIITILGFVISVVIPNIIRLVKYIRKIKADGKITKEEVDGLIDTVSDSAKEINDGIEKVKDEFDTIKNSAKL